MLIIEPTAPPVSSPAPRLSVSDAVPTSSALQSDDRFSTVSSERNKSAVPGRKEGKERCRGCGREVTLDEIGATKKLVNRGTTDYYCLDCLAEYFDVSREDMGKKIIYFKKMGCTLFQH